MMWPSYLTAATAAMLLLAMPTAVLADSSSPSSLSTTEQGSGIEEGSGGVDGSGEIEDISGMCESRVDGFYRLSECGGAFLGCSGGVAWRMACPASLKYDEQNQQCDYPGNVDGCEEGAGEGVDVSGDGSGIDGSDSLLTGPVEVQQQTRPEIPRARDSAPAPDATLAPITPAGVTAAPATYAYASATNAPAAFEGRRKNRILADSSSPSSLSTTEQGSGIEEGSGGVDGSGSEGSGSEGSGIEEGSGEEGSGEIEDISGMCESRVEGFYRLSECGGAFLGCSGGVAWRMACPASLKYDEQNQQCDYPGNVDGCEEGSGEGVDGSGEGSGIDGSGSEGSGSEGSGIEEGSGEEGSGEIEDISGKCESRVDGFYRLSECGGAFLGCSGGVAWRMACPASLKYDEQNQQCDYPGNVDGCEEGSGEGVDGSGEGSGIDDSDSLLTGPVEVQQQTRPEIPRARDSAPAPDATLAPTTPAGVTADPATYAYASATNAPAAFEGRRKNRRDARCKSSDGLFALDCSREFVVCRAGVATKLECGEGETFEENGQSCVPLAHHPTCFTDARQPADIIDNDVQMEKETDDKADLQMPIDHSFACDWTGARAEEPCADWFRLCEGGRGIEMYCMQGHLFDGEAAKCVPAGQLQHCQAQ